MRIDESKLPEREKLSDLRRGRPSHPLPEWVVNMRHFDRNSVFSPAHFAEATPACLAGWHSRWLLYCPVRPDSSTFLRSLRSIPVTGLPRYYGRSDSCGAGSPFSSPQVSLIHVLDLPFPPSPTTLGPSTSISHATPHLVESPAEAGLGFTFPTQAGRLSGRIEFLIVRMERSPPAAPHPALLRRSCSRLQAGERMPEEDFHLSDQARFQAHVGTRCCASVTVTPTRTRSTVSLPNYDSDTLKGIVRLGTLVP